MTDITLPRAELERGMQALEQMYKRAASVDTQEASDRDLQNLADNPMSGEVALEAQEVLFIRGAITALRDRLAQPEQEPVACQYAKDVAMPEHRCAGKCQYAQPEQEQSDAIPNAFNEWWNADYDDTGNPYRKDSPAYWAWSGWKAASKQPEQGTLEGWVKLDEVRKHFDSVRCGTIYKTAGEDRTPLYTTLPQRKPLPPQSPCEMTQAEGKMFKLGWLECEAAHGIKGEA